MSDKLTFNDGVATVEELQRAEEAIKAILNLGDNTANLALVPMVETKVRVCRVYQEIAQILEGDAINKETAEMQKLIEAMVFAKRDLMHSVVQAEGFLKKRKEQPQRGLGRLEDLHL